MFKVLAVKRDAILLSSERFNFNLSSFHVNSNKYTSDLHRDHCVCSMCESDLIFSHRVTKGKRGSNAGVLMLEKPV